MSLLYFVTPAWQRYELSEVCFEQRRRAMAVLEDHGIETRCVVIADDENLDIARSKGFATVEQRNDLGLGRKFNDGYQYAAEHGATWIVPIGSDSWIHPFYFMPLPTRVNRVRSSHFYAAVAHDQMVVCNVAMERCPAGPYVLHRDLLKTTNYRPTGEELNRNLDSSTIRALPPFKWAHRDDHPLQYVGFRHPVHSITSYGALKNRWGVRESQDPWTELKGMYPADLVEAARKAITP